MKKIALIVAGGSGIRMGYPLPKQFLEISGKPVLMHTLEVFERFDPNMEIILVLPQEHLPLWQSLCRKHHFTLHHAIAEGGLTRFQSVKNGLAIIPDEGIVFIHDGVRPLVSEATLQRCHDAAFRHGNAIPALPVGESVRWSDGQSNHPVDRNNLFLIQTPQTFLIPLIKRAYQQEESPEFTDDASVLEKTGETIRLVEGNRENIKITWPADLTFAGILLKNNNTFTD